VHEYHLNLAPYLAQVQERLGDVEFVGGDIHHVAAAQVAQGVDGVDAVAGEHVDGALVIGTGAHPVLVEGGVGRVDGSPLLHQFLAFAAVCVRQRGGLIAHLDVTLVCEAPRIGPHRDAMRARIAEIAGVSIQRVAVKATTSERLGFTGRGEGIAAFATATIRLPWSAS